MLFPIFGGKSIPRGRKAGYQKIAVNLYSGHLQMPSHREKANGDSFSGNWDESLEKYARANIYLIALLNKVLLINKGLFGAQERGYPPGISKVEN